MYDINFIRNTMQLKQEIVSIKSSQISPQELFYTLESYRNENPYIFNIETTNNCNMTCIMCPRTKHMDRRITYIKEDIFNRVLEQIKPHKADDLSNFWSLIKDKYGIDQEERSENSFYFYVVSKCVILHGYGEPLLDPDIITRVKTCTLRDIPTYFSCVPANIRIDRITQLMEAGLGVLKFSMDALDDEGQKKIRGKNNNFAKAFDSIMELLKYKEKNPNLNTKIVVTMISFSQTENDGEQYDKFMKLWEPFPVYAYIKSQDNRWFYKKDSSYTNRSHYASQYCEYPWTSMSVMSNGIAVPCTQDYNAEMNMGDVSKQSLKEIWNSEKYASFRNAHITGNFPEGYKCKSKCDLPKLYERL